MESRESKQGRSYRSPASPGIEKGLLESNMIKQHPPVSGRVVFPEATNNSRSRSRDENGETHAKQQNFSSGDKFRLIRSAIKSAR